MNQSIGLVAIVVRDYDEALGFYIGTLGFQLIEDMPVPAQQKRWVVVAPAGSSSSHLLLARAVGDAQSSRIGNQTGGRVFLFLYTDDFWRDFRSYQGKGVVFECGLVLTECGSGPSDILSYCGSELTDVLGPALGLLSGAFAAVRPS